MASGNSIASNCNTNFYTHVHFQDTAGGECAANRWATRRKPDARLPLLQILQFDADSQESNKKIESYDEKLVSFKRHISDYDNLPTYPRSIMPKFSSSSALRRHLLAAALTFIVLPATTLAADAPLLNVSYDVTRELFKEINPVFIAE